MTKAEVRLGYEVGTGDEVKLPIRHTVVCGITQEAGKTTTLEALIARSGLRAVTFITKRGEGAFTTGHPIPPYFREQADWQFVASLLEASRGEKLKFERAWIIRASKGAQTLAQVHKNVKKLQAQAKGLSADVYLTLDAYLDHVVPTIGQVHWAPSVALAPGVNVMDLSTLPVEMQHLVIKSTLDYVLAHKADTVVVIPEAWKFIPEGRNTPVKLAAEAFIRQAAALKNYLWLDSQDIGGISKTILRSVPVWILGVQREANEIKRTLENLPASTPKVTAANLASLDLGQFYACWGTKAVKTYVQPNWLTESQAKAVAMGRPVDTRLKRDLTTKETHVTEQEAAKLRRENEQLRATVEQLTERVDQLVDQLHARPPVDRVRVTPGEIPPMAPPYPLPDGNGSPDVDALYATIKARLLADAPSLLRTLTTVPEIEVVVDRKTVEVDGKSLKGRLARLMVESFFKDGATASATRTRLKQTGPDVNPANLWRTMQEFVSDGFLRVVNKDYFAVEAAKVRVIER